MKCMETNFGGRSSSLFGDIAMVHVHQVWLAWFFLFSNFKNGLLYIILLYSFFMLLDFWY